VTSVAARTGRHGAESPTDRNPFDDVGPLEAERSIWRLPSSSEIRDLAAGTGLLGRFGYLVLTQVVVVVLGVAYWAVTTRFVVAHAVGVSAAGVSTAMFLSAIGVLGIGSLLLVELHAADADERRSIMVVGLGVAVVSGSVCAVVVLVLSAHLGHSLSEIGQSPADSALFVVGTVLTIAASVLDSIAIGMHRSRVQLARNTAASGLRLAFVVAAVTVGVRSTTMLLAAWVVSLALSAGYSSAAFGLWRSPRTLFHLVSNGKVIGRYRALALRHHALNLAITSVTYFLPVLAALLLVPSDYAYFSIAQLVASGALLVPALLAMTLFAEASGSDELLSRHIRRTLPIGFAFCAVLLGILEPAAPWVLHVFGKEYAVHGTTTLRLLLLGGLPYVVKDHWVAIRRAQRRLSEAARWVACAMIFEAAAAAAGAKLYGLAGLCGFWVAATVLEVPFFAPGVARVWRVRPGSTGSSAGTDPDVGAGPIPLKLPVDVWWAPSTVVSRPVVRPTRPASGRSVRAAPRGDQSEQWWW
jgi:O-antigen/teichoic acid export membrane protein